MPAKSKAQFRLMKAVASGSLAVPGLDKEQAKEYTKANTGKKAYSKLKEKLSKEKK